MTGRAKAGTSKAATVDRRRLFVRAYIANGQNATQTAITAGYNPNGAGVQGLRLLKDPYIAEEIAKVAERSCQAAGLGVERTLRELACVAYTDPAEPVMVDSGSTYPAPRTSGMPRITDRASAARRNRRNAIAGPRNFRATGQAYSPCIDGRHPAAVTPEGRVS